MDGEYRATEGIASRRRSRQSFAISAALVCAYSLDMHSCVLLLTLFVQATAAEPPGWRAAKDKALDLSIAGKDQEVIALYEPFVAKYPKFAEGHVMLGAAHEQVGRGAVRNRLPDPVATRMKHYELAITHTRRGIEIAGASAPFDWWRGYIDIHGIVGVDRPAEYERLVREAVVKYANDPYAHGYMLFVLANKGESIAAAAKTARASIPKTADARVDLAGFVTNFVKDYQRLMPASGATALLNEASALVDEALRMKPGDRSALRVKTNIDQLRKPPA